MVKSSVSALAILLAAVLSLPACGLFYQAGTRMKASHMSGELKKGDSMVEIHNRFGEPDLREYTNDKTEVWSYAYKPNSNDITAALLYTSTKEGDRGTFLDLKFTDGQLVSWSEAEHTMPAKEMSGFGAGISAPGITGPQPANSPTSHY